MDVSNAVLLLASLLAFYLAWNVGANDVANSMGTSVGSGAVTLRQALLIAAGLEFTGAVFFGQNVAATLTTKIADPQLFVSLPQLLLLGMLAVLITCGIWMNLATVLGLPVSSSHAIVGAIAGFACVAVGSQAIAWSSLGVISLTWIATPVVSGAIAALFYWVIKRWILEHPEPVKQLQEWIPWLSAVLFGILGIVVLPVVSQPLHHWLTVQLGLHIPPHDLPLGIGALAAIAFTTYSWRQLRQVTQGRWQDGHSLERYASVSNQSQLMVIELLLARFQLLSASFVAFAHGANDVGNAVAPMAAIAYIQQTGFVPQRGMTVPLWVLVLGAAGIVSGLAVWGKKVITTVGEGIISLQPSGGFCVELATATTVLLASRMGLPVSTSHALVGGVVGIGLAQMTTISLSTLRSIGVAWVVTIPLSALLSGIVFIMLRWLVQLF